MSRALLLCACVLAGLGCGDPQRDKALVATKARTPAERAKAIRELSAKARARDSEAWLAVSRAARDPAAEVKLAAIEALGRAPKSGELVKIEEGGPPDPDDTLAGSLGDVRDEVRVAAAKALAQRCGPRAKGYLIGAFARSGPVVRAALAEALSRCGSSVADALRHWEKRRRERALQLLASNSGAQRARGAAELGLLGRDEDVKALMPLLDESDGVVVAAAAKALGDAGAASVAPRLALLLADRATTIAAAAADGLAALGGQAVQRATTELREAIARPDEASFSAAAALVAGQIHASILCGAAGKARFARAAELLAAAGACAAPAFVDWLFTAREDAHARALLAALLVVPAEPVERAGPVLARWVESKDPQIAAHAAMVAERLQARGAGPALVAVVQRERKAIEAERSAPKLKPPNAEDDAAVAAELVREAAKAPQADRAKYDALMQKLAARGQIQDARDTARARLGALLDEAPLRRRTVLVAALSAALALQAKGIEAEAKRLAADPEPDLARLARGEREPAPPRKEDPADACLPQEGSGRAPPPGCVARLAVEGVPPAAAAKARQAVRFALLADDGADRAAACNLAKTLDGPAADAPTAPLQDDPERRVRVACSAKAPENKTRAGQPR